MNTNLILVTNVPKYVKQVDLVSKLENKWARVTFIDNPFADLYDAFIYNPTSLQSHFEMGIARLKHFTCDGVKPLKVYHLWFPPPNVYLTKMIPENSIMLPFLFVDNLPKESDTFEVIGELPFQANEVKHWDVPQKEDKWMILRLPINQDEAIRDYVLKYIRCRRLSNGLFPRVLEVFVTEESRLNVNMIPRSLKNLPITSTYKSTLLFLYDLSPDLTVKSIVETCKSLGIKGTRAFFIDVVNSLRVGFLFVPKSLPEPRFSNFQVTLSDKIIKLENKATAMLNINEVWLQPKGALIPKLEHKSDDKHFEYILTNYVYVHNVAACVDHNQLTKSSPINFKIYLFQLMENTTQVGFVCLRGLSDERISQIINHLRSLKFDGYQVMVDNIYLKCFELPECHQERRSVHVPRNCIEDNINVTFNNQGEIVLVEDVDFGEAQEIEEEDEATGVSSCIILAPEPTEDLRLVKSDFIFMGGIPYEAEDKELNHIGIDDENFNIMSSEQNKVAFFYYPDTNLETWLNILEKIAMRKIRGVEIDVCEVFLQSDETEELIEKSTEGILPSKYIFVYNISDISDTRKLEENDKIVRFSMMSPESGSCAFVELVSGLNTLEIIETITYIRGITQRESKLCADLVWFAKIKVKVHDPSKLRSKWIKKSALAKKRKIGV